MHRHARVADLRALHFQPQVVAFAGPFAHAGKHRIAAVLGGDSRDQFLDHHGLADARPAEQARLAALDERAQQIDDLDARLEHLRLGRQVGKLRRLAMDRAGYP